MSSFGSLLRHVIPSLFLALACVWTSAPTKASSPVKLHNAIIMCDDFEAPVSSLTMEGMASHLGSFHAVGEISFDSGISSPAIVGSGVVVMTAANGDQLAGVITLNISPFVDGEADVLVHISWRDEVEFADGSVCASTGRFAVRRPPGIAVAGIGSRQWISLPICIVIPPGR